MIEILDYVKAVSNPARLQIIGLLSQGAASRSEMSARLGLSLRQVTGHLAFLQKADVVRLNQDLYEMNTDALERLSRYHLERKRETYTPDLGLPSSSARILRAYLNADGSIRQLPSQPDKLQVMLDHLLQSFSVDVDYSEKEVNTI